MDQSNDDYLADDETMVNLLLEDYDDTNVNFQLIENKTNKRFAEVSANDIVEFLEENENKNTKRKTKGDIQLVQAFLSTQNEHRNIEFIPPTQLNEYLATFILSVKKRDGGEYEPSTLQSFISSVDRHLKACGYQTPAKDSIEVTKTRSVLQMKQKQLKSLGKGNKPNAAEPLEQAHIETMLEAGTLGDSSPAALIHSLWLVCTTNFGMRTGQEICNLQWGDIQCQQDSIHGEYLVYDTERQTKTRTGANIRNIRPTKPKAYTVPDAPKQDPVHLYKLYAEKRPAEMMNPESPFFLTVANQAPKSGQAWYKKQAIGINKLYAIMKEMKADTGIPVEKRITPYSARKRLIQTLNDSDIPAHQIVQVSGHKNINSLNNYSKLNPEQSKKISNILVSGKSPAYTGDAERASVPPSQSAVPLNQANPLLHTGQYVPPPYPVPLHYSQYVPSPFLNQCLPPRTKQSQCIPTSLSNACWKYFQWASNISI